MLFAILIDKSWQTWPPDPSGEYQKVRDGGESVCLPEVARLRGCEVLRVPLTAHCPRPRRGSSGIMSSVCGLALRCSPARSLQLWFLVRSALHTSAWKPDPGTLSNEMLLLLLLGRVPKAGMTKAKIFVAHHRIQ